MNEKFFERNLGFISAEEQLCLHQSVVAIAGAGGDGGLLAIELTRMGIGELRLADPDTFDVENINRQAVCSAKTLGMNKASAVAEYLKLINPDIKVDIYDEGITQDNVNEFLLGADLVIDETEFTLHSLAIMLARKARIEGIPNMTVFNIGFGSVATTFTPDGPRLETILGFSEKQDLEEIAASAVSIDRWLPYVPSYGDLKVLGKVASGEKSAPSIAPGVSLSAALGATQAFLNLVKGIENHRPNPVSAPKAIVVDVMSVTAKTINFNRLSHYRYLAHAVVRNILKINPTASY